MDSVPQHPNSVNVSFRNDRYNKKLKKYYVVYEENDTELSEDEERHEKKDVEAPCKINVDVHF